MLKGLNIMSDIGDLFEEIDLEIRTNKVMPSNYLLKEW